MPESTSAALFAQLRELSQPMSSDAPAPTPADSVGAQRTASLRAKLEMRPKLGPILRKTGEILHEWRGSSVQPEHCAALRSGHLAWNRPLACSEFGTWVQVAKPGRVGFFSSIASSMISTFLLAFQIARSRDELCEQSAWLHDFLARGNVSGCGNPDDYMERETNPGIFVVAGLASTALELQALPSLEQTKRILHNTKPMLLAWSLLPEEGFEICSAQATVKPKLAPGVRKAGWLGFDPTQFELCGPSDDEARIEFTAVAQAAIASLACEQIPLRSPYRIGCGGVKVRAGQENLVEDSLTWVGEILTCAWPYLFPAH